jgi:UDP-N-acetylmuramoyl-L-alanyl-D-glutamate--2,6-diaminopimelate ligase
MKILRQLLEESKYTVWGNMEGLDSSVNDIVYNSAKAYEGTVFVCIKGERSNGHDFADNAYRSGARLFLCEERLSLPKDATQIIVSDTRKELAKISAEFFSHPEKKLKLIGITGTKGKTSVCAMITHIMEKAGKSVASIGTVGIKIGADTQATENSTPESYILYKNFAKMVELGVEYVVMEVSSQALFKSRVDGMLFSAAVYTNLSSDHIGDGEHPSFEHYKECKKRLFAYADVAFLNGDDIFSSEFASSIACPIFSYGFSAGHDISAGDTLHFRKSDVFGVSFSVVIHGRRYGVDLPLPGDFSVYNALAAIAVCTHFGISPELCANALCDVRVRGRFEIIPSHLKDVVCIVDYAHNAESISSVLRAMREYDPIRIICIFGSVGGRTKHRRREMALAANELADICIVTSDNPDSEPAEEIIGEIAAYISPEKCVCITDRADAVRYALKIAERGDFVIFAGKGHEEYQLIDGKKLPFSERELIEEFI